MSACGHVDGPVSKSKRRRASSANYLVGQVFSIPELRQTSEYAVILLRSSKGPHPDRLFQLCVAH